MNRRRWLKIVTISVSCVTLALFGGRRLYRRWRYRELSAEEAAELIHEHFAYLQLDRQGVLQFVHDYQQDRGPIHANPNSNFYMNYLMSTDFFAHDADESRVVLFQSRYDPYYGCENPFAVLD